MEKDTIDEVDVYMAYGLVHQAEEVLLAVLKRDSKNSNYAAKLIEVYFTTEEKIKFQIAVEAFLNAYGKNDSN